MRFEFEEKTEKQKYSFIVHIVEHEGYGTLHQLVNQLQIEPNQKVFFTHDMPVFKFNLSDTYILHVTGHMYPIISNLDILSRKCIKYLLFLHVAPNYFQFKQEKLFFLDYLKDIQRKYCIKILCPSENVARQYKDIGINVNYAQLRIEKIYELKRKIELQPYYNKYVTVCTSPDFRYIALKGVDIFVNQMEKITEKEDILILGFDGEYMGVKCRRLGYEDFLNVLSHSKAYIQFSRTEAYNLTAVQAKQLRIPVLVSNVDGHIDCMKLKCNLCKKDELLESIISKINEVRTEEVITQNYRDSIQRESIDNFVKSIIKNVEE